MKIFVTILAVGLAASCYASEDEVVQQSQPQTQAAGSVRSGFCGLGGCFGRGGSKPSGGSGGRGNQAYLERAPGFPSGSGSGGRSRFPGFGRRTRRDFSDSQTQEVQQQQPETPAAIGVRAGFCGLGGCFGRGGGKKTQPKPYMSGPGVPSFGRPSNSKPIVGPYGYKWQ